MYHSNKTQLPVQTDLGEAGILPTNSYTKQVGFVLTTQKLQTLKKWNIKNLMWGLQLRLLFRRKIFSFQGCWLMCNSVAVITAHRPSRPLKWWLRLYGGMLAHHFHVQEMCTEEYSWYYGVSEISLDTIVLKRTLCQLSIPSNTWFAHFVTPCGKAQWNCLSDVTYLTVFSCTVSGSETGQGPGERRGLRLEGLKRGCSAISDWEISQQPPECPLRNHTL